MFQETGYRQLFGHPHHGSGSVQPVDARIVHRNIRWVNLTYSHKSRLIVAALRNLRYASISATRQVNVRVIYHDGSYSRLPLSEDCRTGAAALRYFHHCPTPNVGPVDIIIVNRNTVWTQQIVSKNN